MDLSLSMYGFSSLESAYNSPGSMVVLLCPIVPLWNVITSALIWISWNASYEEGALGLHDRRLAIQYSVYRLLDNHVITLLANKEDWIPWNPPSWTWINMGLFSYIYRALKLISQSGTITWWSNELIEDGCMICMVSYNWQLLVTNLVLPSGCLDCYCLHTCIGSFLFRV